jgi:hypothetical protein
MKARINNGRITSIGFDDSLQHKIPNEINYQNYRYFKCVNMDKTEDYSSWVPCEPEPIVYVQEQEVSSEQVFEQEYVSPETEEVEFVETGKPEINVLKIFSYVTLIVFMVLLVPSFIQTLKEKDWVSAVVLVVFGAIGSTLLSTIYKDVKSWIKK